MRETTTALRKHAIAAIAAVVLILPGMSQATNSRHPDLQPVVAVSYLSSDVLWSVVLNRNEPAAHLVDRWELPRRPGASFGGLACAAGSKLLLHASEPDPLGKHPPQARLKYLDPASRTIETLEPGVSGTNVTFPRASGDGRLIAAHAYDPAERDQLALYSTTSGITEKYSFPGLGNPQAWSPDGRYVHLTALASSGDNWIRVRFDRDLKKFEVLGEGGRPEPSPDGRSTAYISHDHRMLVVEQAGARSSSFPGFFKDLVGWLNSDELVFVTGRLYRDEIGIASLTARRTQTFSLPSTGEINGACLTGR